MSKPIWRGLPPAARYIAQDEDGGWYWYVGEPIPYAEEGVWDPGEELFRFIYRDDPNPNWINTLEECPYD